MKNGGHYYIVEECIFLQYRTPGMRVVRHFPGVPCSSSNGNNCKLADRHQYIYDLDDPPPLRLAVTYGVQWVIIVFPALIAAAVLPARVLHFSPAEEVRFLQLILLSSGFSTLVQCLWGHRYPVVDGPSTALLLTFLVLAPFGIPVIQAGTILGGILLMGTVLVAKPEKITTLMSPNVVGVILMLVALTLLPYLSRLMTGAEAAASGSTQTFVLSMALVLLMATLSYRLKGFFKTIWLLIGMTVGTALFFALKHPDVKAIASAAWFSIPPAIVPSRPEISLPAVIAFAVSYIAVVVNSVGSIQAIADITNRERLTRAIPRGLFINGIFGVICGMMGIIGTVSYSMSPGVVLSIRVASRFAVAWGGFLLILAALVPKLAALFALIPAPVVGAALCTAMGIQIGAALSIIAGKGISQRSYYVVGLPVLAGTLIAYLPQDVVNTVPPVFRVFLGNGLIFGILLVLLLEHVLMREKQPG